MVYNDLWINTETVFEISSELWVSLVKSLILSSISLLAEVTCKPESRNRQDLDTIFEDEQFCKFENLKI